jgi:glycosyltransferase involved in cell wall biosynthesis
MKADGPTRVLYCEGNVDGTVGGSHYSLFYLVEGLDRRRYDPIVVFYTNHTLLPAFRDAGVETLVWQKPTSFKFGADLRRVRGFFRFAWPPVLAFQKVLNFMLRFLLPVLAKTWFLRWNRVKIVHLNNSILYNHDWMLSAKLARARCVTHERGINQEYSRSARFFGRRLDALICISDAVKGHLIKSGFDSGNLLLIYNGLEPSWGTADAGRVAGLRKEHGLVEGRPVIGIVGNIRGWKGQETVIRATGIVKARYPDIKCFVIGGASESDLAYESYLHGLVAQLKLTEQVVFTGFQIHVAEYISLLDILIHASLSPEPFGRVVLEGMALKKPVIGSQGGAIPEIIEEGVTGVMYPPGDADRLAMEILELLENRDRASQMGLSGYARLVEHFSLSKNIEATQNLYERILSAPY